MINFMFGAGRKLGYRNAKGPQNKGQRQPFKTKCKSQYIKEYYEKYFPELYREWGVDFNRICPVKPADINAWLKQPNLPDPPNPAKDLA